MKGAASPVFVVFIRHSPFAIRHSFSIQHSAFGIRHSALTER
jgi:hypothetical protein